VKVVIKRSVIIILALLFFTKGKLVKTNSLINNLKVISKFIFCNKRMKYWSCCQRKTSDFDTFLNQEGCQEGSHLWFKSEVIIKQTNKNYH
jgi:hypothetical protein